MDFHLWVLVDDDEYELQQRVLKTQFDWLVVPEERSHSKPDIFLRTSRYYGRKLIWRSVTRSSMDSWNVCMSIFRSLGQW